MMRHAAVAGSFYTDDPDQLHRDLCRMVHPSDAPRQVMGIVAPHAGYIYSGGIAGRVYGEISIPETVMILGPNHHGLGAPVAVYPGQGWQTPLGPVAIDGVLAGLVLEEVAAAEADAAAHLREHSLEVQVPFLQHLQKDVRIVPICLGFGDLGGCRVVGEGLARAIARFGRPVLLVASSDMTHYESAEAAREKDDAAIAAMLALDPVALHGVCRQRRITMCGVIPATVMLYACLGLGASQARLVAYGTSGDVTGDQRQVVAYAALEVW
jgi:AmmeMemoRadiSam system protein B